MKLRDMFEHEGDPYLCIGFDGQSVRAIQLNTGERREMILKKNPKPIFCKDLQEGKPVEVKIFVEGGNVQEILGSSKHINVTLIDYDNNPETTVEREKKFDQVMKETPFLLL